VTQIFIDKLVRSPLTRDNVTATECCRWLIRIDTCVKEKGGYFEHKLCYFNSSV